MISRNFCCRWCNKPYASAGWYRNHLRAEHPDMREVSGASLPRRKVEDFQQEPYTDITEAAASEFEEIESSDSSIDARSENNSEENDNEANNNEENDNGENDSDIEPLVKPASSQSHMSDANGVTFHLICRCSRRLKAGEIVREFPFSQQRSPTFNHLYPFHTARDYNLARFFTVSKIPKKQIDRFFEDKILLTPTGNGPTSDISFQSGHTFYRQTSKMVQDPEWRSGCVEFPLRPKSVFQYRDILDCIQYLLRQRAFVNNMLWAPIQAFNDEGERMYSEINTGSWW